jgi:hypothetical protein
MKMESACAWSTSLSKECRIIAIRDGTDMTVYSPASKTQVGKLALLLLTTQKKQAFYKH